MKRKNEEKFLEQSKQKFNPQEKKKKTGQLFFLGDSVDAIYPQTNEWNLASIIDFIDENKLKIHFKQTSHLDDIIIDKLTSDQIAPAYTHTKEKPKIFS